MCAFDEDASIIIFYNMNKEHACDGSLMAVVHDMIDANLASRPKLDEWTHVQLQQMSLTLKSSAGDEGLVQRNLQGRLDSEITRRYNAPRQKALGCWCRFLEFE